MKIFNKLIMLMLMSIMLVGCKQVEKSNTYSFSIDTKENGKLNYEIAIASNEKENQNIIVVYTFAEYYKDWQTEEVNPNTQWDINTIIWTCEEDYISVFDDKYQYAIDNDYPIKLLQYFRDVNNWKKSHFIVQENNSSDNDLFVFDASLNLRMFYSFDFDEILIF